MQHLSQFEAPIISGKYFSVDKTVGASRCIELNHLHRLLLAPFEDDNLRPLPVDSAPRGRSSGATPQGWRCLRNRHRYGVDPVSGMSPTLLHLSVGLRGLPPSSSPDLIRISPLTRSPLRTYQAVPGWPGILTNKPPALSFTPRVALCAPLPLCVQDVVLLLRWHQARLTLLPPAVLYNPRRFFIHAALAA